MLTYFLNKLLKRKVKHKYKVGQKVILVNDFGYCAGIKTITSLEWFPLSRYPDADQSPRYHYEGTDTPWYPCPERNLIKATKQDLKLTREKLQNKYGFKPKELFGCY